MTYRPLPEYLTIKNSNIEGLGLFATETIFKGEILGITHIKKKGFQHGYIRTPLGGFINYSEYPNSETIGPGKSRDIEPGTLELRVLRDIEPGEEITLKYTLYKPNKNEE